MLFSRPTVWCTILCCLVLGSFSYSACAEESRIWSDKSGKHEIRAKFVDFKDGKVRLERPNGDITRISLDKLCEADQKYLRERKNNPQPPTSTKPEEPRGLAIGDHVEAKQFREWKKGVVVDIDYQWERVDVRIDGESSMAWPISLDKLRLPGTTQRPILIDPVKVATSKLNFIPANMNDVTRPISDGSVKTQLAADPRPALNTNWKPKPVRLQGRTDFHEKPLDFSIVTRPHPLVLVLHSPPGVGDGRPGRIEMVDLRSRKTLAGGSSLPNTKKVCIAPSGKQVVTVAGGHSDDDEEVGRIDLWTIEGKKVNHSVGFSPYPAETWPNAEAKWVGWLDDQQLFTSNSKGRLILWQAKTATAVYELMIDRGSSPTLSPGKKQLAIPTADGVEIYAANSGALLAKVGSGNLRSAKLAFSPSGRQIAAVSRGFVDVIDVTTGEITRSFPCKNVHGSKGVWWVDEEYLFAANSLLINVPRRIIAWKFKVGQSLSVSAAGTQWLLVDDRSKETQILAPMQLPPPAAVQAVNKLDDEELLAVRPGASVSIDVRINDSLLAQSVEKALTSACESAGMTIVEGGNLVLDASMTNGETEEVNYRSFGDFRGKGETISVTSRVYLLRLLLDGVPVWERKSVHSSPHHIRMNRGESVRAAIQRIMKPKASSFHGRLPAYVVRPEHQEPLGVSTISPNG